MSAIKRENKVKLAALVKEKTGVVVSPDALFDIQVKRIHEYKRQLLNVFAIIHRYNALKAMSDHERRSRFLACASSAGKPPPGTTWPSASSSSSPRSGRW